MRRGLAGLSNCSGRHAPGISAVIRAATARAFSGESDGALQSVNTTRAP